MTDDLIQDGPFAGLPCRAFQVIYADPPWRFETYSDNGKDRSADRHYDTMSVGEIKRLPVRELAAEDCFLFMWTTSPHEALGVAVMRKWGFRYSGTAFTWAKQLRIGDGWHMGMGYSTRQNTERVLLGRKGNPARMARDVPELLVHPVMAHSRKPEEVRGRIERFAGMVPRIELFARQRASGWVSWGNEVGKQEDAV